MEHKLITGGEQYLPFARSRIKALRATGLKYASQQFEIDGCSVKVRIEPGHEYISLSGGGGGYQFFTTRPDLPGAIAYRPGYVTSVKGGPKPKPKAVASSAENDTQDPKRWRYQPSVTGINDDFPREGVWQIEGITEYCYYAKDPETDPAKRSPTGVAPYPFLVSSWSSADPLHTLGIRSGMNGMERGEYDRGYDVDPSFFKSKSAGKPLSLAPDADWYKRAAFKVVTHPQFGRRTFIVLTDITNTFYVYPVNAPEDRTLAQDSPYSHQHIKTSVSDTYVRKQSAPLPEWCRKPLPGVKARDMFTLPVRDYIRAVPQYRWAFNSTCTKAVSVVFEDLVPYVMAQAVLDNPSAYCIRPEFSGEADQLASLVESLPGYVELNLDIHITGERPEDFTFSLTFAAESRPTVNNRFVMAAEYAWEIAGSTALDDLVVIEAEITFDIPPDDGVLPVSSVSNPNGLVVPDPDILHTSDSPYLTHRARDSWHVTYSPTAALDPSLNRCVLRVKNEASGAELRAFVAHSPSKTLWPWQRATRYNFPGNPNTISRLASETGFTQGPVTETFAHLLGYDLRSLSFIVQCGYVETPVALSELHEQNGSNVQSYGFGASEAVSFRQAQMIRVYAKNVLEDEKIVDPDSPVNAALIAAHADTAVRGEKMLPTVRLSRRGGNLFGQSLDAEFAGYSPQDRPVVDAPFSGGITGRSVFASRIGSVPNRYPEGITTAGDGSDHWSRQDFNAGACLYGVVAGRAFQLDAKGAQITVHPSGHWSAVADPIYYFSGHGVMDAPSPPSGIPRRAEYQQPYVATSSIAWVAGMRQADIDLIRFKKARPDQSGEAFHKTTHRELFAEVFGKDKDQVAPPYTFSILWKPVSSVNQYGDPSAGFEAYLVAQGPDSENRRVHWLYNYNTTRFGGFMAARYIDSRRFRGNGFESIGHPVVFPSNKGVPEYPYTVATAFVYPLGHDASIQLGAASAPPSQYVGRAGYDLQRDTVLKPLSSLSPVLAGSRLFF